MARAKRTEKQIEESEIAPELVEFREQIQGMDHTEILELMNLINEDAEPEKTRILSEAYLSIEAKIELPPIGLRVWTHFYERYILRLGAIVWAVIIFLVLKGVLIQQIQRPLFALGALALWALWHVWMAWLESRSGSSYLRRTAGIRVVKSDGTPPGFLISLLRTFFKGLPLSLLTLITIEHSRTGRGIHDKIFGTTVVMAESHTTPAEIRDFLRTL